MQQHEQAPIYSEAQQYRQARIYSEEEQQISSSAGIDAHEAHVEKTLNGATYDPLLNGFFFGALGGIGERIYSMAIERQSPEQFTLRSLLVVGIIGLLAASISRVNLLIANRRVDNQMRRNNSRPS